MNDFAPRTYAFIDESGNTDLDTAKIGASEYFVIAAVLIKGSDLSTAIELAEQIRRLHFQAGEMKSSGVGPNDARRLKILEALKSLPARHIVLAVDKKQISKDSGLIYKQSFLKYLYGRLYEKIFRNFSNLEALADEHGNEEFMKGFRKYVYERCVPQLFERSTLEFASSKSSPLIQVADLIAGTIARVFAFKDQAQVAGPLYSALKPSLLIVEEWPPISSYLALNPPPNNFDEKVRHYCFEQIGIYRQRLNLDDHEDQLRDAVIMFLSYMAGDPNSDDFIHADAIANHLEELGFADITVYTLRTKIISHFRDGGVIIASDSRGYKLPTKVSDISSYVHRCDAVVHPMIKRLKLARGQIQMMSHGELDILHNYPFLKSVCE